MTAESQPDARGDFGGEAGTGGRARQLAGDAHRLAAGHVQSETGHSDDEMARLLPRAGQPVDLAPLRERFGGGESR